MVLEPVENLESVFILKATGLNGAALSFLVEFQDLE